MKELLEYIFKDLINYLLVMSFIFINLMLLLSCVKVVIETSIPKMVRSCVDYYFASKVSIKKYELEIENKLLND
jgi:hypothetical protein